MMSSTAMPMILNVVMIGSVRLATLRILRWRIDEAEEQNPLHRAFRERRADGRPSRDRRKRDGEDDSGEESSDRAFHGQVLIIKLTAQNGLFAVPVFPVPPAAVVSDWSAVD